MATEGILLEPIRTYQRPTSGVTIKPPTPKPTPTPTTVSVATAPDHKMMDEGSGVVAGGGGGKGKGVVRLWTGALVGGVPAEFCDDLDALTNDVDYLLSSDEFHTMRYDAGSFPTPFLQWFLRRIVPFYNLDRHAATPLVTARKRKNGPLVIRTHKS